jgi:AraC-like DNA-binding protein
MGPRAGRSARIDEAKRLLGSTALPIKEVATLSGFSSLEYLSRAFAAATGLSPTAWRERF